MISKVTLNYDNCTRYRNVFIQYNNEIRTKIKQSWKFITSSRNCRADGENIGLITSCHRIFFLMHKYFLTNFKDKINFSFF